MKRIRTFITLCLLAFGMAAVAQQPALIPVPSSVDWASGTYTCLLYTSDAADEL